ncbi:hypothetical protein D3C75_1141120 [compost metagenome]
MVPSSCTFIMKEPSPDTQTTVSSGRAIWAPTAAGTPKPMVPKPLEVMKFSGRSKVMCCAVHIWCWPTSVVITLLAGLRSDNCFNNSGA